MTTMQENEAFGRFLLETIAGVYGCKAEAPRVNREVFKATECGAWVQFDDAGILVGTIVEGSDAEFSLRVTVADLDCDDASAAKLVERWNDAIERCEEFANVHWEGK